MDVRLSGEQQALRDSVAQVAARLGPRSIRDLEDAERRAKLDAAVEAAGWRELRGPGEGSAPLASGVEAAIVAEELARGLADVSFLGPVLAAELRRAAGCEPWRPRETVGLVPDLSRLAGERAADDLSRAVAVDAGGREWALVLLPGGPPARLAAAAIRPVRTTASTVDLTRPAAAVSAAPGEVEALGTRSLDRADLTRWTALGLALTCAELLGTMRGALDLTTDYARTRRQFGAAIGSLQAVQHLLADALVCLEGSRSISLFAAWAVDACSPDDALAGAALAKAYCARAARQVCETAIQVHGGVGNTWDCLAHVYLRRAVLSIDVLGGVGPNLDRVLAARGIGIGDRATGGDERDTGGGRGVR